MYKFSYNDISEDSGANARGCERRALELSIERLRAIGLGPAAAKQKTEALLLVNRLWSFLLEDLARPDNGLPKELRASLISIGFWVLRESDAISEGKSENIKGLIEVTEMIAEGLQ